MNIRSVLLLIVLASVPAVALGQAAADPNAPPPDYVAYDRAPEPQKLVQAKYPASARGQGAQGTVWVKVWVGKNGKVRKAVVSKTDAPSLNEAAIEAAEQWEFTPAVVRNNPVDVWVSIPFKFKLVK